MKIQPEKPDPKHTAMASTRGDLRQLKRNSSATVAELKAFLKELKGRSPQEMLGIVASSQLVRAIGMSCLIVFGGIVIFTAIPYAMGGREKNEVAESKETAAPAPKAPVASPDPTPTSNANDSPPGADPSLLGIGEEKPAPPNKNPLENTQDDFLDGLE